MNALLALDSLPSDQLFRGGLAVKRLPTIKFNRGRTGPKCRHRRENRWSLRSFLVKSKLTGQQTGWRPVNQSENRQTNLKTGKCQETGWNNIRERGTCGPTPDEGQVDEILWWCHFHQKSQLNVSFVHYGRSHFQDKCPTLELKQWIHLKQNMASAQW